MKTRTILGLLLAGAIFAGAVAPASAATYHHKKHSKRMAHRHMAATTKAHAVRTTRITTTISPAVPGSTTAHPASTGTGVTVDPQHPLPAPAPNPNAPAGTSGTTNADQTGSSNGTGSKNGGTAGRNGGSSDTGSGAVAKP